MKYVKSAMSITEKQRLEVTGMKLNAQATEQEKQAAKLDYIAMMADIDLSDIVADEDEEEGMPYAEQEVHAGQEVL